MGETGGAVPVSSQPGFRADLAAAGWAVVAGTVGCAVQQRHGGHLPSDGTQGSAQSGAHHQAAAAAVRSGQDGSGWRSSSPTRSASRASKRSSSARTSASRWRSRVSV